MGVLIHVMTCGDVRREMRRRGDEREVMRERWDETEVR